MKKEIFYSIVLILVITFILIFRPVNTSESNSIKVTGIVEKVYEGGVKDIIFKIYNDPKIYYINRGIENGLDLNELQKEMTGQEISLWYARHWTPLDPKDKCAHITKLEFKN
ncbi:MAG: hypothetical protein KAW86_01825, partial [Bacteroidales bacterium]|nr:hypothetical protein [Bacteroidales bacterium]